LPAGEDPGRSQAVQPSNGGARTGDEAMIAPHDADTLRDFKQAVNLCASELAAWLETDESKSVGFKTAYATESVGHRSGRRILRILRKRPSALTSADFKHMQKVIGYIHRHLGQWPRGDVSKTPWRYSLMNWGHDPIKA
jgi:hypothetical protein